MMKWEKENGAKIPESYKEWLRFTGQCRIAQNTAIFWGPNKFHSEYVPDDLVVIGELIGEANECVFRKQKGCLSVDLRVKRNWINHLTV